METITEELWVLRGLRVLLVLFIIFLSGCEDTNLPLATEAGIDVFKAVTLSDAAVKAYAREAAEMSDGKYRVAALVSSYHQRLERLVGKYGREGEHIFNYKVYLSNEVNAFAMADGTIRVHSKLMDIMNDGELRFIVGHEMGHIVKGHIRNKIKLAYAGSALRKGIASQENLAGDIARSSLGGVAEKLLNAQFSQQEERDADSYGLLFLQQQGYESSAAVSALRKLAAKSAGYSLLSSHPGAQSRAERLEQQRLHPQDQTTVGLWDTVVHFLKSMFRVLKNLLPA